MTSAPFLPPVGQLWSPGAVHSLFLCWGKGTHQFGLPGQGPARDIPWHRAGCRGSQSHGCPCPLVGKHLAEPGQDSSILNAVCGR